jgi:hypothetical protein
MHRARPWSADSNQPDIRVTRRCLLWCKVWYMLARSTGLTYASVIRSWTRLCQPARVETHRGQSNFPSFRHLLSPALDVIIRGSTSMMLITKSVQVRPRSSACAMAAGACLYLQHNDAEPRSTECYPLSVLESDVDATSLICHRYISLTCRTIEGH